MNSWTLNQCRTYANDFNNFYYDRDFSEKFDKLLSGLDESSSDEIKFILMRMNFLAFLNRESMFSEAEEEALKVQMNNIDAIKNQGSYYSLFEYKFVNCNMTIHNFYDDLGLKKIEHIDFSREREIIDVGAYIGDSSLILSKYTKKNVYAFEPFSDAFEELNQNIKLNEKDNILPFKLGLSNDIGRKQLFFSDDALSISTNDPEKSLSKGACTHVMEIETTTIDHFSKVHNLDIGIIKIDAEGSEQAVLLGAIQTIKSQKPILLISIYHNIDDFISIKPWVDSLGLGYSYKLTKPEATTLIEETMLICYQKNEKK
ncbi:MAG: FkbM family methyltransferase [Sulfuricurvum sp.]|nr:FkbM family methyltransferase [Sulfuricurvum sp.]